MTQAEGFGGAPPGDGQPAGPSWTFWVEGPRRRARLVLRGSFFVVGRLEPFAVFQDDPMISRDHAAIVAVEGGVRVRDLGSRNGVLLDGKRLERYAEVDLPPGAVLHVGQTSIRLLREGERPEAPAARADDDDEVTVDEEGQTKGRLAALDAAALAGSGSADDVAGEVTGELDVPEVLPDQADEAEVEAVAAAVREAAGPTSVEREDALEARRFDAGAETKAAPSPGPAPEVERDAATILEPSDAAEPEDEPELLDEVEPDAPGKAPGDAIDRLFE